MKKKMPKPSAGNWYFQKRFDGGEKMRRKSREESLPQWEPIKNRAKRIIVRIVKGGKPRKKLRCGMGDVFMQRQNG